MKNLLALSALAAVLALSGCQSTNKELQSLVLYPATTEGEVVAEFDGVKITDTYLNAYIKQLPPGIITRYNTPKKREGLILKILDGEMLARAAFKEGVTKDPALLIRIKAAIAQYYARDVIGARIVEKTKISEEEMREYYENKKKKFDRPAKRRASHILVKVSQKASKEKQDKALARARKILEEVKKESGKAGSFARLAKKYSDDKVRNKKGGDVGFFARTEHGGPMAKAFSDAAFALSKKGDVSDVVRTKIGYHIIKFTGKTGPVSRTFGEVKPSIASTLKAMKRQSAYKSAMEEVKKKMNFQVNKEAIAAIDFGMPEGAKEGPKPQSPK
ncbi:MAG: hypothetical protein GY849_24915 [Deltaproteobacteria bacterium]|nr:hypothetical protein [Deltaproteobacteria bacterium]